MPRLKSQKARRELVDQLAHVFARTMPDPRCELYYESPYQLLISVVLSAQATDKSVNQAMTSLYQKGLGPQEVLDLGREGFLEKIRRIGLAPTKAKNVLALTQILTEKYAGEVPRNREDLEALPGVGRKTANVILGELYGEPTLAVDTHAYRLGLRLGLHQEKTPLKAELTMLKVIKAEHLPRLHHWFVLHGRYVCKAQKPQCASCAIATLCPYPNKT